MQNRAHAVWLYFRFSLRFRNVEDLLAQRETIAHTPPEDRARLEYDIALAIGTRAGLSDVGTKELAALVKRRIEWSLFARRNTNDSEGHT